MIGLAHLRSVRRGEFPLFSSPGVRRFFLLCKECRRVVPVWKLVGVKVNHPGCRCGCLYTKPRNIPEWQAAYWLCVRGLLIRKLILRKTDWDPRLPSQELELPS